MNYPSGFRETGDLVYPWGKKAKEGNDSHRLEYHCADVAACFEALITQPVFRQRMEAAAGCKLNDGQISRLCALSFLHDFGKLNTAFQLQLKDRAHGHIHEAYCLNEVNKEIAAEIFLDIQNWESFIDYCVCALSHHGSPVLVLDNANTYRRCWDTHEKYDPLQHTKTFMECLHKWFPQAFCENSSSSLPSSHAFHHGFAGLLMLADWLGSDSDFFPFVCDKEIDPSYFALARKSAATAIQKTGLAKHAGVNDELKPETFGVSGFTQFNSVQKAVKDAPTDARLVILESETGSGKTEAAFIRFAQLFAANKVDGMYFAVPTRSAAKQLHSRINRVFKQYAGDETVLAVPGYIIAGETKGRQLPDWKVLWDDNPSAQQKNERWAAESSKRFLAARCAVGTVDQVLLSGLRVRHSHLRAASLMRSLLVVDEVHASDVYMNKILNNILKRHCDALGGYAMLMSATLGSSAQCRYLGQELPELGDAIKTQYPMLHISGKTAQAIEAQGSCKKVEMKEQHCMTNSEEVAKIAIQEAERGAKVLLIRNTVNLAIDTAQQIEKLGGDKLLMRCKGVTAIHHGRFASTDRFILDEEVEKALSPGSREVQGLIVIGTQTLEQSLDIDADVLITDLCPVDVLLQRIGRLHRHLDTSRPQDQMQPICHVLVPSDELTPENEGLRKYGIGIDSVYEDMRVLAATLQQINKHEIWEIPSMNRQLVESATHPSVLAEWEEHGEIWQDHANKLEGGDMAGKMQADRCSVKWDCAFDDVNENCTQNEDEKIRTRLGDSSVDVEFDEQTSVFGGKVSKLSIPHYWLRNFDSQQKADIEDIGEGVFYLNINSNRFKYSKFGLSKDSG